jgi:predicted Co/Zn/Cd cation transporter (cation efflux family)
VRVVVDPATQVSGPSIGLLVTGIIGGVFSIIGLFMSFLGTSISSLMADRFDEFDERYTELYEGAAGIASSFIGILVAALIIYAALKMKELSQYGLCIAASILAMIPCISPCCIIGLPIGIWCLIVLTKPEVKAAFH